MRTRGRILSAVVSVVLVTLSLSGGRMAAQGGRAAAVRRAEGAVAQRVATLSLTGTVRDASGAVLPGVTVVLAPDDAAGGSERTTTSDAEGAFRFDRLTAGVYRIEASAPGFTRFVQRGVSVSAGQAASLTIVLRSRLSTAPPPDVALPAPPPPRPTGPPVPIGGPPPVAGERTPPGTGSGRPASLDSGLAVIPVFYATDRQKIVAPALSYSSGRNATGSLSLGRYDVSIPRDHQMGTVERPSIWTLWQEDPAKHFVIVSRTEQSYDNFYADIRRVVGKSTHKDAFVFVHGYNVAFEDAVFRTAQIAYDLGFDGAPILYSWPSDTGETPIGYTAAQNNNDWTVAHLDFFLRDVAAKTGATRIHVIAHSMGNRALVNALSRMPTPQTKPFNQIVLTAPDMDAQTFIQLADALKRAAARTTLYASASDKALLISKQLNAYPRAGDTGAGVVIVDGIDTIDVTAVDSNLVGHYYYGDNRSVISDIFLLFTEGLPPTSRPMLRSDGVAPRLFWRFVR